MAVLSTNSIPITIPVLLAGLAFASIFLRLILQYWSLKHIPGPFPARFTNFWLARKFWKRESFKDIALDLHNRYGSIVRYGPDRVLFSDLSAVPVVFNTKRALRKVSWVCYPPLQHMLNFTRTVWILWSCFPGCKWHDDQLLRNNTGRSSS